VYEAVCGSLLGCELCRYEGVGEVEAASVGAVVELLEGKGRGGGKEGRWYRRACMIWNGRKDRVAVVYT
jgi:hypothetical protein